MRGVAGVDLTEDLARDLGAAAAAVAGPGCSGRPRARHARVGPGARGRPRRGDRLGRRRRAHGRGASRRPAWRCWSAGSGPSWAASSRPRTTRTRTTASSSSEPTGASCPTPPRPTSRPRWARAPGRGGGRVEPVENAVERYVDWLAETYGDGVRGDRRVVLRLRERRRRGRRAAPRREARPRRRVHRRRARRPEHQRRGRLHASRHARRGRCGPAGAECGIAFDGDADRCLAVDADGRPANGDAIIAALAIDRRRHERAGRRPGRRHVDDQPRVPPAHARARDRGRGDRRRRPLRARADARDRRDARRRAVRPRGRPRRTTRPATGSRRRSCCSACSTGSTSRWPGSSTSCSRSRRSSSPSRPTGRRWRAPTGSGRRCGPPRRSWGRTAAWCSGRRAPSRSCGSWSRPLDATECERLCDHLSDVVAAEIGGTA